MKGRVLAGKYRLVAELGRGGMGSVWRADHVELRSPVAVKLIDPALADTREGQSRFLREARAAGSLRSTHVVSVFDYGVDEGTPFLVMELLEGESLATRLEKRGRLPLAEVSALMKQVVRGLSKAHAAGIVHRDLKPENIFITIEGDSEVIKVLDFGIAKVQANIAVSVQTQTGMVLGTPYYMSPEQAEGRRELDARSDIWSLGVIVYECLLGARPFDGDNLAQIILAICADALPIPSKVAETPPGFDAWFARAVARRLDERFQTVQELADELALLATAPAVQTAATDPAPAVAVASPRPVQPQRDVSPDVMKSSSLEWSKDPAPAKSVRGDSYQTGSVRAISTSARVAMAFLLVAALAVVGGGAWFWSRSGVSESEAAGELLPGATTSAGAAVASAVGAGAVGASANDVDSRSVRRLDIAERGDNLESAGVNRGASVASAGESAAPTSPKPHLTAPGSTGTSNASPAVATSHASGSSAGSASGPSAGSASASASSRPAAAAGGASKSEPAKVPNQAGLYCSHNAISGRLVRSSPGKVGSFPCYVHSLSGELRKKD